MPRRMRAVLRVFTGWVAVKRTGRELVGDALVVFDRMVMNAGTLSGAGVNGIVLLLLCGVSMRNWVCDFVAKEPTDNHSE